jgi:hypothetical protein
MLPLLRSMARCRGAGTSSEVGLLEAPIRHLKYVLGLIAGQRPGNR